jgi:hypothetical protein
MVERSAARVYQRNLSDAKIAKQDEFYTQLADIERELRHYRQHFKGKVVYCNADDRRVPTKAVARKVACRRDCCRLPRFPVP